MSRPFRMVSLTAFVAKDEDGDEGLCAALIGGTWLPMVAADEARVAQLRPLADEIARKSGKPIELIRFVRGAVVETLEGK